MAIIRTLILLSVVLSLMSCSSQPDKLKISATTWVGYSPLFYAKAKGWLKPLNIQLQHVVSLSENLYLYQAGNADAYVGTQYEYRIIRDKTPSLRPVMMFDRSNGGDLILSNTSIDKLKSTGQKVDVYLEIDSINKLLLDNFIHKYGIDQAKLNLINQDQALISSLEAVNLKHPTVIVTYTPYNVSLDKKGFHEIASTKGNLDLLVVDALFTTEEVLKNHRNQFEALKKLVDRAVVALNKNPEEFYETVKPYMLEVSYQEFMHSLNDIVWINDQLSPDLIRRLEKNDFSMGALL